MSDQRSKSPKRLKLLLALAKSRKGGERALQTGMSLIATEAVETLNKSEATNDNVTLLRPYNTDLSIESAVSTCLYLEDLSGPLSAKFGS